MERICQGDYKLQGRDLYQSGLKIADGFGEIPAFVRMTVYQEKANSVLKVQTGGV